MELLLAFVAGLLTLINPCVLPVLPIVLASAMQAGRLTEELMSRIGAVMMILFGLILLIPRLNSAFATATTSLSQNAEGNLSQMPITSLKSHFFGGLLLGAIWSPCVGPTLGGAISMASQGTDLWRAFLIMLSFGLGVSTVIIALGFGTQEAIRKSLSA